MNNDKTTDNRRILVIDDNVSIHEDIRKILLPPKDSELLNQARAALFGEAPSLPPQEHYELEFASQGREGCGMVHTAYGKGRPYAMAFVDMLMPPGWDGLETIENLWYVDPDLEVVICTAYSDHPWEDVSRRIGNTDKLLILMKPFHSIEVVQLANSLTKKWNLTRTVKLQIDSLAFCVNKRTVELCEANDRLQENIAGRIAEAVKDQPQGDAVAVFRQKEEFLAIISHEILTPMNELVGKVSLLLDSPLNPGQREHATTIQRCVQDLLALLKDMHEFMAGWRQETRTVGLPMTTAIPSARTERTE
jgi:CheY-like chemotaxis protein